MSADPRSGLGSARCISPEKMRQIRCSEAVALGCCLILAFLPRPAKPGVPGTPRSAPGRGLVRAARVKVCGAACCRGWTSGPQVGRCTKPLCIPRCRNGGFCQQPQTCACKPGFEGRRCETEIQLRHQSNVTVPSARPLEVGSTSSSLKGERGREGRKTVISRYVGWKKATVRRQPLSVKQSQAMLLRKLSSKLPAAAKSHSPMHIAEGWGSQAILRRAGHRHSAVKQSELKAGWGPEPSGTPMDFRLCALWWSALLVPLTVSQITEVQKIKILFTPTVCQQKCEAGRCEKRCERGNVTTVYSDSSPADRATAGFRAFLCTFRCQNGGVCVGRERCRCTAGFTGRACQIPASSRSSQVPISFPTEEPVAVSKPRIRSSYTLPLSNQRLRHPNQRIPSVVNLQVDHPPEVSVKIHQVSRVNGRRNNSSALQPIVRGTHQRALRDQAVEDRLGSLTVIPPSGGDYQFGYCFTEITNGQCASPLTGLRTLEHCCRGGGVGWGVTECNECPVSPESDCPQGFQKAADGECQDINECNSPRICQNGKCMNMRGSYSCVCNPGYVQDTSKSRCISQQVISPTRGPCYRIWRSGFCSLPVVQNITKQICCCSRVGKAWGPNCQRCPSLGTGAFREVCPAGPGYHYTRSDLHYSNRVNEEHSQNRGQLNLVRQTSTLAPRGRHTVAPRLREMTTIAILPTSTTTAPPRRTTPAPQLHICLRVPQVCGPGHCIMRQQGYTCACHAGFRLNAERSRCIDLDECGQRPSPCPNGRCENVVGSYRCVCSRGFVANSQGTACTDIDECSNELACPNSECVNSIGSFNCLPCRTGYQIRDQKCTDIDECGQRPSPCPNGRCENVVGSYRCVCSRGFVANSQGTACTDLDECGQRPSPCPNGRCENVVGSYRCVCSRGFVANSQGTACTASKDGTELLELKREERITMKVKVKTMSRGEGFISYPGTVISQLSIVDLDECGQRPSPCPNGQCENVVGSYRCVCSRGFVANSQGTACTDLDECGQRPSPCPNGQCENVVGSYRCVCSRGFVANSQGTACTASKGGTELLELKREERITMKVKVKTMSRGEGFISHPGTVISQLSIVDLDECGQRPSPCPNGQCENVVGSYRCVCSRGFVANSQGTACTDIDECSNELACPNSECVNSIGSFHCLPCPSGYQIRDRKCTDLDECGQRPSPCPNGRCENVVGSYRCVCSRGFLANSQGTACTDIDECSNELACPNSECVNSIGSFHCLPCPSGYQIRDRKCTDMDECGQRPSPCPNGRCENVVGSYRCVCSRGFVVNSQGTACTDIDECSNELVCPNSECVNSIGSFHCLPCPSGYQIRDRKCTDIDECVRGATCGEAGMCVNTEGSYQCRCNPGYRLRADGNQCADINECFEGDYCAPYGECLNNVGSYTCLCAEGFTTSPDLSTCLDVDECTIAGRCGRGRCANTVGSFECSCEPGFRVDADRSQCLDLDECVEYPTICGSKRCKNTPGSFQCITECGAGFQLSPTLQCVDIDECSNATICGPNAYCQNVAASFRCHCDQGYQRASDGTQCVDLDECVEYPTIRGSKRCKNTPGSFQCITECGAGFQLSPTLQCVDIDECSNATICGPNAYCQNVAASFRCHCDQGYQRASDGTQCVDVNECQIMQGVCGAASCENVPGSFLCICLDQKEEFDPVTGQCNRRAEHATPAREKNECYYNLNDVQLCQNILASNVTRQECCCTVGEGWGKDCRIYQCPVYDSDEYRSLCPQGRGFISLPHPTFERSYTDADECTLFGTEVCKNGVCVNTIPGYSCYCPFGYYYHSTLLECIDNDECEDADVCDNGDCVNTVGSYYCSCQPPLILDVTLRRCTSNDTEQFDVHMALCWQEVGRNYLCKRPFLERLTTYTECCCQYGEAWGMDCALCPTRNTEYHNALCSYLSSPTDEDDGYPYGLEYENYGPQFEPEFPPDTFRPYDPQEYDAGPSPLSDGRGSSPPEFEPYPAAEPVGGRTFYESRQQRSGPAHREQSSPSRSRYRPRTRHRGRVFSTRSIRVSLPEQQNRQPDAPPDPRPGLISNNRQYHTQFQQYNSLRVEECGILNGCENGRCIRVPEGFTCDCDTGYRLDMTKMTCIDINECDEVEDPTVLCRNAKCVNTDGSYRCICLRGYVLSRQPNHCTTVQGSVRGTGL